MFLLRWELLLSNICDKITVKNNVRYCYKFVLGILFSNFCMKKLKYSVDWKHSYERAVARHINLLSEVHYWNHFSWNIFQPTVQPTLQIAIHIELKHVTGPCKLKISKCICKFTQFKYRTLRQKEDFHMYHSTVRYVKIEFHFSSRTLLSYST